MCVDEENLANFPTSLNTVPCGSEHAAILGRKRTREILLLFRLLLLLLFFLLLIRWRIRIVFIFLDVHFEEKCAIMHVEKFSLKIPLYANSN